MKIIHVLSDFKRCNWHIALRISSWDLMIWLSQTRKWIFTFCLFPGTLNRPSSAVRCTSAAARARTMLGAQLQVSSHRIMSLRTRVSKDTPNTEPSVNKWHIRKCTKTYSLKTFSLWLWLIVIVFYDKKWNFLPSFLFFLGDFLFWKGRE